MFCVGDHKIQSELNFIVKWFRMEIVLFTEYPTIKFLLHLLYTFLKSIHFYIYKMNFIELNLQNQ